MCNIYFYIYIIYVLGEVPGPSSAAIWSAAVAPSAACKYNMKSHTSLMTGEGGGLIGLV